MSGGRFPTTYIAIARNVTDGDADQFAVLDWTVEAGSPDEAAAIVGRRHPGVAFAIVPARFFSQYPAAPYRMTNAPSHHDERRMSR